MLSMCSIWCRLVRGWKQTEATSLMAQAAVAPGSSLMIQDLSGYEEKVSPSTKDDATSLNNKDVSLKPYSISQSCMNGSEKSTSSMFCQYFTCEVNPSNNADSSYCGSSCTGRGENASASIPDDAKPDKKIIWCDNNKQASVITPRQVVKLDHWTLFMTDRSTESTPEVTLSSSLASDSPICGSPSSMPQSPSSPIPESPKQESSALLPLATQRRLSNSLITVLLEARYMEKEELNDSHRPVLVESVSKAYAWRCRRFFDVIAHTNAVNFMVMVEAFFNNCLMLDNDLRVTKLITVDCTGEPGQMSVHKMIPESVSSGGYYRTAPQFRRGSDIEQPIVYQPFCQENNWNPHRKSVSRTTFSSPHRSCDKTTYIDDTDLPTDLKIVCPRGWALDGQKFDIGCSLNLYEPYMSETNDQALVPSHQKGLNVRTNPMGEFWLDFESCRKKANDNMIAEENTCESSCEQMSFESTDLGASLESEEADQETTNVTSKDEPKSSNVHEECSQHSEIKETVSVEDLFHSPENFPAIVTMGSETPPAMVHGFNSQQVKSKASHTLRRKKVKSFKESRINDDSEKKFRTLMKEDCPVKVRAPKLFHSGKKSHNIDLQLYKDHNSENVTLLIKDNLANIIENYILQSQPLLNKSKSPSNLSLDETFEFSNKKKDNKSNSGTKNGLTAQAEVFISDDVDAVIQKQPQQQLEEILTCVDAKVSNAEATLNYTSPNNSVIDLIHESAQKPMEIINDNTDPFAVEQFSNLINEALIERQFTETESLSYTKNDENEEAIALKYDVNTLEMKEIEENQRQASHMDDIHLVKPRIVDGERIEFDAENKDQGIPKKDPFIVEEQSALKSEIPITKGKCMVGTDLFGMEEFCHASSVSFSIDAFGIEEICENKDGKSVPCDETILSEANNTDTFGMEQFGQMSSLDSNQSEGMISVISQVFMSSCDISPSSLNHSIDISNEEMDIIEKTNTETNPGLSNLEKVPSVTDLGCDSSKPLSSESETFDLPIPSIHNYHESIQFDVPNESPTFEVVDNGSLRSPILSELSTHVNHIDGELSNTPSSDPLHWTNKADENISEVSNFPNEYSTDHQLDHDQHSAADDSSQLESNSFSTQQTEIENETNFNSENEINCSQDIEKGDEYHAESELQDGSMGSSKYINHHVDSDRYRLPVSPVDSVPESGFSSLKEIYPSCPVENPFNESVSRVSTSKSKDSLTFSDNGRMVGTDTLSDDIETLSYQTGSNVSIFGSRTASVDGSFSSLDSCLNAKDCYGVGDKLPEFDLDTVSIPNNFCGRGLFRQFSLQAAPTKSDFNNTLCEEKSKCSSTENFPSKLLESFNASTVSAVSAIGVQEPVSIGGYNEFPPYQCHADKVEKPQTISLDEITNQNSLASPEDLHVLDSETSNETTSFSSLRLREEDSKILNVEFGTVSDNSTDGNKIIEQNVNAEGGPPSEHSTESSTLQKSELAAPVKDSISPGVKRKNKKKVRKYMRSHRSNKVSSLPPNCENQQQYEDFKDSREIPQMNQSFMEFSSDSDCSQSDKKSVQEKVCLKSPNSTVKFPHFDAVRAQVKPRHRNKKHSSPSDINRREENIDPNRKKLKSPLNSLLPEIDCSLPSKIWKPKRKCKKSENSKKKQKSTEDDKYETKLKKDKHVEDGKAESKTMSSIKSFLKRKKPNENKLSNSLDDKPSHFLSSFQRKSKSQNASPVSKSRSRNSPIDKSSITVLNHTFRESPITSNEFGELSSFEKTNQWVRNLSSDYQEHNSSLPDIRIKSSDLTPSPQSKVTKSPLKCPIKSPQLYKRVLTRNISSSQESVDTYSSLSPVGSPHGSPKKGGRYILGGNATVQSTGGVGLPLPCRGPVGRRYRTMSVGGHSGLEGVSEETFSSICSPATTRKNSYHYSPNISKRSSSMEILVFGTIKEHRCDESGDVDGKSLTREGSFQLHKEISVETLNETPKRRKSENYHEYIHKPKDRHSLQNSTMSLCEIDETEPMNSFRSSQDALPMHQSLTRTHRSNSNPHTPNKQLSEAKKKCRKKRKSHQKKEDNVLGNSVASLSGSITLSQTLPRSVTGSPLRSVDYTSDYQPSSQLNCSQKSLVEQRLDEMLSTPKQCDKMAPNSPKVIVTEPLDDECDEVLRDSFSSVNIADSNSPEGDLADSACGGHDKADEASAEGGEGGQQDNRPPNILVYTSNNDAYFNAIKTTLLKCFKTERYAIYHLDNDTAFTSPWSTNTSLLVICGNVQSHIDRVFIRYLLDGGKVLSICSDFLNMAVPLFGTVELAESPVVQVRYGKWRSVAFLHHEHCSHSTHNKSRFSTNFENTFFLVVMNSHQLVVGDFARGVTFLSDCSTMSFAVSYLPFDIRNIFFGSVPCIIISYPSQSGESAEGGAVERAKRVSGTVSVEPTYAQVTDVDGSTHRLQLSVLATDNTWGAPSIIGATVEGGGGRAVFSQVHLEDVSEKYDPMVMSLEEVKESAEARKEILRDLLHSQLSMDTTDSNEPEQQTYQPAVLIGNNKLKEEFMEHLEGKLLPGRVLHRPHMELRFAEDDFPSSAASLSVVSEAECEDFNECLYSSHLTTQHLGRLLLYTPVIGSTHRVVEGTTKLWHGFTVTARRQTEGTGRGGNVWLSPPGCLMFSIQLHLPLSSFLGSHLPLIQHVASLAVVRAFKDHSMTPSLTIKWPNDLLLGDSKIGGNIVTTSHSGKHAIVNIGMGINLTNAAPTVSIHSALSEGESPSALSTEVTLASILNELESVILRIECQGPEWFIEEYCKHWRHTGAVVDVVHGQVPSHPSASGHITRRNRTVSISGIDSFGFLKGTDCDSGERLSIHPDGNSFNMMEGLVYTKVK